MTDILIKLKDYLLDNKNIKYSRNKISPRIRYNFNNK